MLLASNLSRQKRTFRWQQILWILSKLLLRRWRIFRSNSQVSHFLSESYKASLKSLSPLKWEKTLWKRVSSSFKSKLLNEQLQRAFGEPVRRSAKLFADNSKLTGGFSLFWVALKQLGLFEDLKFISRRFVFLVDLDATKRIGYTVRF